MQFPAQEQPKDRQITVNFLGDDQRGEQVGHAAPSLMQESQSNARTMPITSSLEFSPCRQNCQLISRKGGAGLLAEAPQSAGVLAGLTGPAGWPSLATFL